MLSIMPLINRFKSVLVELKFLGALRSVHISSPHTAMSATSVNEVQILAYLSMDESQAACSM